jgi:hypothetical protein
MANMGGVGQLYLIDPTTGNELLLGSCYRTDDITYVFGEDSVIDVIISIIMYLNSGEEN